MLVVTKGTRPGYGLFKRHPTGFVYILPTSCIIKVDIVLDQIGIGHLHHTAKLPLNIPNLIEYRLSADAATDACDIVRHLFDNHIRSECLWCQTVRNQCGRIAGGCCCCWRCWCCIGCDGRRFVARLLLRRCARHRWRCCWRCHCDWFGIQHMRLMLMLQQQLLNLKLLLCGCPIIAVRNNDAIAGQWNLTTEENLKKMFC